jgi:hypothetical protein
MELDGDHVNSRCASVGRVVDKIATHSGSCAVGVLLLWAIIYTDSRIRDVAFAVMWMSSRQMKTIVLVPLLTPGMP